MNAPIMILLQRITSPYVRRQPANLRARRYLRPVADQGWCDVCGDWLSGHTGVHCSVLG